jgi:sec-independent protein translocase protein TatC
MTTKASDLDALVSDRDETDEHDDEVAQSRMGFLEHLDELRRRLLYSVYVLTACCVVTFFYWERLYLYYAAYFQEVGGNLNAQLIFNKPMAGFMFSLKISGLAGLVIAAPFIFSQAWLFVAPGLYAREKRVVLPFVFFSSILFFLGAYFAHEVAFPSMWRFFASYAVGGISFFPTIDETFSFYVKAILGLGLVFQMPMVVFFLARFGVVTAGFLVRKIRYAVLIIVVVAAVITPSGDPLTLAIFAAPMLLLYVVSIGVAWVFQKKQSDRE